MPWNALPKGGGAGTPAANKAAKEKKQQEEAAAKKEEKEKAEKRKEVQAARKERKRKEREARREKNAAGAPAPAKDAKVDAMDVEEPALNEALKTKGLERMLKLLGLQGMQEGESTYDFGSLYLKPRAKTPPTVEVALAKVMKGDTAAGLAEMLARLKKSREPLDDGDGMANLLDQEIARAEQELTKAEKKKPGSAVQLEALRDGRKKDVDAHTKAAQAAIDAGVKARERHQVHLEALDQAILTLQNRRVQVKSHFEEVATMWDSEATAQDEHHNALIVAYDKMIESMAQLVVAPGAGVGGAANQAVVEVKDKDGDLADVRLEFAAAKLEDLPKIAPEFLKTHDTALTKAWAFYTMFRFRSVPMIKYGDLGLSPDVVAEMVGETIWKGLYGIRVGTIDEEDLIPRQLHLIFGQAMTNAMAQVVQNEASAVKLEEATAVWKEYEDKGRLKHEKHAMCPW